MLRSRDDSVIVGDRVDADRDGIIARPAEVDITPNAPLWHMRDECARCGVPVGGGERWGICEASAVGEEAAATASSHPAMKTYVWRAQSATAGAVKLMKTRARSTSCDYLKAKRTSDATCERSGNNATGTSLSFRSLGVVLISRLKHLKASMTVRWGQAWSTSACFGIYHQ